MKDIFYCKMICSVIYFECYGKVISERPMNGEHVVRIYVPRKAIVLQMIHVLWLQSQIRDVRC